MNDELRRIEADQRDLAKRLLIVERQIGKLPLRIAHTSGGSAAGGGGDLPIYFAPTWAQLLDITPTESFAIGWTWDYHVGFWIVPSGQTGNFDNWFNVLHWTLES